LSQEPFERARRIWLEADKRKALDLVILDVGKLTIICDYFVVCSGRSMTHIESLAEGIADAVEDYGIRASRKTSRKDAKWVVLDFDDVVVHILAEDARSYYDLEGLWSQADAIRLSSEELEDLEGADETEGALTGEE
jgi:ribosome-associated protein